MGDYAARFDAGLLSAADAAHAVEEASAIEKMAATVKALAASRVAPTDLWRRRGDRSAAHELARRTGTSVGEAAQALETGRRLGSLPETAAAARRGELSPQQTSAIADAAGADPGAESDLLQQAKRASLQELKDHCARTKAAAVPDPDARRRRIHTSRYLRTYNDAEGAWNLHMRDNPEVGAEIMAAVAPIRDRLVAQARSDGRREPLEAYDADALVELARDSSEHDGVPERSASDEASTEPARSPKKSAANTKILVRVDLEALLRGYSAHGECCELVGYGPVAVSAIDDMVRTADPFLVAVATKGKDVVGAAHLGRRPTVHQRSALEWLHPTCAAEGCSALGRLQIDHRLDWAKSHITVFDLLDRLCGHHHGLKTHEGWALVKGNGKRAFVAPDDPRHPCRANAPPGAA
ncbi:MAG: 13E12 repeat family protein [Actinomycetota bacterium]|nr:13E12 repeat family protein [Actinomycetota bacterium]